MLVPALMRRPRTGLHNRPVPKRLRSTFFSLGSRTSKLKVESCQVRKRASLASISRSI